ncbi:patatin-like phospholipase family protein [Marinilabilia salmonicolor]|uniref:patatin-like phospholipase family protein n=1 Tax=Marinilabilia salmonicolor TaxID=989 RepID=UPI0002FBCBBC|nr:patatin-like phospholipase family protein [Marinilabilia salmonicolor]
MGWFNWFSKEKNKSEDADPEKVVVPIENKYDHDIGIALSGGSARGFAHIGVLRALDENGMSPDIVSGTSMGALIGVLYAAGYSPDQILEVVKKEKIYNLVSLRIGQKGFFELDAVKKILKNKIEKDDFSALKKPFYLSVANITDGKNEVKGEKGPLIDFVLASCSVPVIILPQVIDGVTYIDGGLFDNLPAQSIKDKCQTLIGVHVNYNGPMKDIEGMKDIAQRAFSLGIEQNVVESRKLCDFVIEPEEMKGFTFFDFDRIDDLVEVGYKATLKLIKEELAPVLKKDKIEEQETQV